EPDQEAAQKEVGKPSERQDSIGRHGGMVEKVAPDPPFFGALPKSRVAVEGNLREEVARKRADLLDEWRVLRVEAKIPAGQIGVSGAQMNRFVAGLRVGCEKRHSFRQEEEKHADGGGPCQPAALDLFHKSAYHKGLYCCGQGRNAAPSSNSLLRIS